MKTKQPSVAINEPIYNSESLMALLSISSEELDGYIGQGLPSYSPDGSNVYFLHSDLVNYLLRYPMQDKPARRPSHPRLGSVTLPEGSMSVEEFVQEYGSICTSMPKWKGISERRRKKVERLIYLLGRTGADQRRQAGLLFAEMSGASRYYITKPWYTLDWVLKGDKYLKILEGCLREGKAE